MAKKLYLLFNHYAKTPAPSADNVIEGVGTGAYKCSFSVFSNLLAPGVIHNIWGDVFFDGNSKKIGVHCWTGFSWEMTYFDYAFSDGIEYKVDIERDASGNTTLTIDDVLVDTIADSNYDWAAIDAEAASQGYWSLGKGTPSWHFVSQGFQFYKGETLVIDLPLDGDFTENANSIVFSVEGSGKGANGFCDVISFPDLSESGVDGERGVAYYGGNWTWLADLGIGFIIAGDVSSAGGSKGGGFLHFPIAIPNTESINSAKVLFSGLDLTGFVGFATGTGGVGTSAKWTAHKNNISSLITNLVDYQTVLGSLAGGSGDGVLTSSINYNDEILSDSVPFSSESPELKTIVEEIKALGSINGLTIILHDHEGNSASDKSYVPSAFFTAPVLVVNYGGAPSTYTVTYDANGGSGTITDPNSPYEDSEEVTVLASTGISREGHLFAGWNTAADGSGTDYAPAATFAMPAENVTLYAQWAEIPEYSVTYDGNENTGGSVPTDENTYEEDEEVTVLGNTGSLVKTGYTFAGWNTAADGSGTDYAPAATFAMPAENVTLYAQWDEIPGYKIQLKKPCLIKPVLEKIGLVRPRLIKSK